MSHRRTFLKQVAALAGAAGAAGAAGVGDLLAIDEALERELASLGSNGERAEPFSGLRERYLLGKDITYFNNASIGTIPRPVHQAHVGYLALCETNPWLFMWGGAWEEPREAVRAKAADYMGCAASDVTFTHNTTEGFNTLAQGLELGPGDQVLFSSLNHDGASICWFYQAQRKGFAVKRFDFPVLDTPQLSAEDVLDIYDRQISSATRVLVLPHIDNVVGLRHPVKQLTQLARSRGVEIVAVDGAQSIGMLEVDVTDVGADVYCTSPHKWLQAPKGLGLMYIRAELRDAVRPMWVTWGQERWRGTARIFEDYGSRNLPEVISLGDAIDFQVKLGSKAKLERYEALWKRFADAARASDTVVWRSPGSWDLSASVYALEIQGRQSRAVFDKLYHDYGFVFRPFATQGLNTIRISPNVYNTEAEIERFFDALAAA